MQCLGYGLACDQGLLGCPGRGFLSNPITLLPQFLLDFRIWVNTATFKCNQRLLLIWGKARKWTDLGHLEVLGVPWLQEVPEGLVR